jgi:tetratricopeptide (TPR) repeat protein
MTLLASLLRDLENPKLSVNERAELSCEAAKKYEDKGEYEKARAMLRDFWRNLGERPNLAGLEATTAAELLLRAGVLTGAIGSKNQIGETEESARNLISESLTIFETRRYKKKIAEAQTELALCYWRTGEYNEARDFLKGALTHLTTDSEVKGKAIVRLAIVERGAANFERALRILTKSAPLFQKLNSQTLKGSYHVTLGIILRNLWEAEKRAEYIDRALIEYAAASYHFEQAEHRCYLANTENNLGFLYYKIGRYGEAHAHLDHARRVLVGLKDSITVAQVDETRACVFLEQGKIVEAERVVRYAVRTFEKSDRPALLAEALVTHGRALARLGNHSTALAAFRRAIDLAEHAGSMNRAADAALAAFHEIGDHLAVTEGHSFTATGKLLADIQTLERELVERALESAHGRITYAARSLGMSHQTLNYMLHTRHKDLLEKRKPARRDSRNDKAKR